MENVKVSSETAKYLNLLKGFENLWSEIYSALEEDYENKEIDEIFERDFESHLSSVKDGVMKHLHASIDRKVLGSRGYSSLQVVEYNASLNYQQKVFSVCG